MVKFIVRYIVSDRGTQATSVNAAASSASALVTRTPTLPTGAVRYAEAITQKTSTLSSRQRKEHEQEPPPPPPPPEAVVGFVPPVLVALSNPGSGVPIPFVSKD